MFSPSKRLKLLIKLGADRDMRNAYGDTPLHCLLQALPRTECTKKVAEILKLVPLVSTSRNVTWANDTGWIPFISARSDQNVKLMRAMEKGVEKEGKAAWQKVMAFVLEHDRENNSSSNNHDDSDSSSDDSGDYTSDNIADDDDDPDSSSDDSADYSYTLDNLPVYDPRDVHEA